MDYKRALEIIKRKTSIPEEGETFDDISEAFNLAAAAIENIILAKPWSVLDVDVDGESKELDLGGI